jgi:hypothetical protein
MIDIWNKKITQTFRKLISVVLFIGIRTKVKIDKGNSKGAIIVNGKKINVSILLRVLQ